MTNENKTPKDEATQEAAPVHKSLASALARAQSEMGKALKSANNPHFNKKYADLASVADACMPSLTKHGIAVIQPTFDDDTGRYVKTILIHGESGETLECRVPLIVQRNDMQGYGSAVTYARRYGLMGIRWNSIWAKTKFEATSEEFDKERLAPNGYDGGQL